MTIAEYTSILRRRKWLVLAAIILGLGLFLGYELVKPDRYQASADVLLNDQTAASLVGLAQPISSDAADRVAETQKALARVPELARRTLSALGITDQTPSEFLKNSSVRTKPNQDILEFSVTDGDRAQAIALATEYARRFPIYRRELDTEAINRARREVQAQLLTARLRGGTKSPLYASLSEQLRQLRTLGALQTTSAQLVRPAETAEQVQPRPVRAAVIGLMLGIFGGIAFALIRDATDTRLRSPVEIADALQLPLLARIPAPPKGMTGVVSLEKPRSVEAEAFRILRTNLELINLERDATTIMVASGTEGEGKTTTAANLAVALAKAGKNVVAVDLDLRRPGLGRLFSIANEPGITDVVLSRTDLWGAMRTVMNGVAPATGGTPGTIQDARVPQGSLHYIGTGIVPPNPGEFIATHAVADLLNGLKKSADFVIVDSPPLLSVGDGIALMSQVDAVLVVSRLTKNRRPIIGELKRVLDSSPGDVLGVVVTDVPASDGYGQYPSYGAERSLERPAPLPEPASLQNE